MSNRIISDLDFQSVRWTILDGLHPIRSEKDQKEDGYMVSQRMEIKVQINPSLNQKLFVILL